MSNLVLIKGDITELELDVIVNAANRRCLGGCGVDGAIHRAAEKELLKECMTLNGCRTGEAKLTKGYDLPAKHVIHTVGPIYGETVFDAELLNECYVNSLKIVSDNNFKSIVFPAISCGVYGYPITEASKIAIHTCYEFLKFHPDVKIYFVLFSLDDYKVYENCLNELLASPPRW